MYTCGYFLRYKKRISLKFFSQNVPGTWWDSFIFSFLVKHYWHDLFLQWFFRSKLLCDIVLGLFLCINDYLKLIEILGKKYYPRHFIMYLLNLFGLAGCNCENKTKLELPFCYYTLPSFTVFCWPPWILIPFFEMFKTLFA